MRLYSLALLPLIVAQSSSDSFSSAASDAPSSLSVAASPSVPSLAASSAPSLATSSSSSAAPSSSSALVYSSAGASSAVTSSASNSFVASSSSSPPKPSASFGLVGPPKIPFEDQLPCSCPEGEANYPSCRLEIPPPNQQTCTAEPDCGPYSPQLGPGPTIPLLGATGSMPTATDPSSLTDEELSAYKTMELELFAEFLSRDPLYGEAPLDLPFCGLGDWATTGTLTKRGDVWGKVVSYAKKIGILTERPGRPPAPQRPPPTAPPVQPYCVPKHLSIPIHINIFTTNCTSQNNVSDASVDALIAEMNEFYSPLYITWTKGAVNRYVGGGDIRRFTQNVRGDPFTDSFIMRPEYRHGGVDQLHVFIVESMTDPKLKEGEPLGYCYYPGQSVDGCIIKFDTLPGVSFQHPDDTSFRTLLHEAGHWLNLLHTHDEDEQVKICGGTDDVGDTNQHPYADRFKNEQAVCGAGEVTTETENVRNIMSYATGADRFTQGQRARMFASFYFHRKGIKKQLTCTNAKLNYPAKRTTYTTLDRLQMYRDLPSIKKRTILGQRPNLINELLAVCQTPYSPTEDLTKSLPDANTDIRVPVDTENLNRPKVPVPGNTTGTSGTSDPGTDKPGTGPAGTDTPGTGTSGSETPGSGTSGSGTNGTGTPSTGQAGNETPGTVTNGSGTSGAGTSGNDNPNTTDEEKGREIYHTTLQGTKCLDVRYDWRYNGSPVQLYECNGTPAQKWVIKKGNTAVRLAGTDYCLDAGSHPGDFVSMKIWKCYDIPAQHWYFTEDNRIAVTDRGQCLDLRDGVFEDGAVVQTYKCTDYNTNQIWTVKKAYKGDYKWGSGDRWTR